MLKKYKNFVFDLDGTLFRIPVEWHLVRKEISLLGIPLKEGISLFSQLEEISDKKILEKAFNIIDTFELRSLSKTEQIDNSISIIKRLYDKASLSLVTLQGKSFCDALLRYTGLTGYFSQIITREISLNRRKQLEYAIQRANYSKIDTVFIGDKETDVLSAKLEGIDVATLTGYKGKEKPDYIIKIEDLLSFVDNS